MASGGYFHDTSTHLQRPEYKVTGRLKREWVERGRGTPHKCQTWRYDIKSTQHTLRFLPALFLLQVLVLWICMKLFFSPCEALQIFFSSLCVWFWAASLLTMLQFILYIVEWKKKWYRSRYWKRWVHAFYFTDWCVYCLDLLSYRPAE